MTAQHAEGYSVETTLGLQAFRDGTLMTVADALPNLRQAIQAADLPASAYPAVVNDASKDRAAALDKILQTVQNLNDTVDTHIGTITATTATYNQADNNATTAVTSQLPTTSNTPANQPPRPNHPNDSNSSASNTPPTPADSEGHPAPPPEATPETIFARYRYLEGLFSIAGLAGLIKPTGNLIHANTVHSQPFRQAADLLEQASKTATQHHSTIINGLNNLPEHWTGNAHDTHRTATTNTYPPKFNHLETQLQNQIKKDRTNADIIDTSNSLLHKIIVALIAAVIVGGLLFTPGQIAKILTLLFSIVLLLQALYLLFQK